MISSPVRIFICMQYVRLDNILQIYFFNERRPFWRVTTYFGSQNLIFMDIQFPKTSSNNKWDYNFVRYKIKYDVRYPINFNFRGIDSLQLNNEYRSTKFFHLIFDDPIGIREERIFINFNLAGTINICWADSYKRMPNIFLGQTNGQRFVETLIRRQIFIKINSFNQSRCSHSAVVRQKWRNWQHFFYNKAELRMLFAFIKIQFGHLIALSLIIEFLLRKYSIDYSLHMSPTKLLSKFHDEALWTSVE